jgi:hypothetical protein
VKLEMRQASAAGTTSPPANLRTRRSCGEENDAVSSGYKVTGHTEGV